MHIKYIFFNIYYHLLMEEYSLLKQIWDITDIKIVYVWDVQHVVLINVYTVEWSPQSS